MLLIMALVLLTYQKENAAPSSRKQKKSGGKRCKDCIQVRVTNPLNPTLPAISARNLKERAIVTFDYHTVSIPGGIPDNIMEVRCSKTCRGHEMDMNAVPIRRSIPYLKKEKNIYVLKEMTVTVGCTCVYPDIKEQKMT
uniref:Interleukin-17A/F2 n=1 Tax=Quasipaa spinosa TaxID=109965 RepID=A0A7S9CEA5_QUASP|nr:interleukin-17A/F2 [Quasipaa spinosa]